MTMIRRLTLLAILAFASGCDEGFFAGLDGDDPSGLSYEVVGAADAGTPTGIMLRWLPPRDRDALNYAVYGRTATSGEWYLVGITTSTTFHDAGPLQRQYYVAARDEDEYEFGETRPVTVELGAGLPIPESVTSVSMNRGVQLGWAHNAYQAGPNRFRHYRVYSAAYGASTGCATDRWQLEGTTLTPAFLVSGLTNGVTRCFGISAVTTTGLESAISRTRTDTPRFDARHVAVDVFDARVATSGFVFHDAARAQFGVVTDGTRADVDFRVERSASGGFLLRVTRAEVRMVAVGSGPIPDLASVDLAPASGYTLTSVDALPGHAYAFRIGRSDGIRYGVVRIAYVTATQVVLDWAYQTDPGNPELDVIAAN